jgi:hypothetical protein
VLSKFFKLSNTAAASSACEELLQTSADTNLQKQTLKNKQSKGRQIERRTEEEPNIKSRIEQLHI